MTDSENKSHQDEDFIDVVEEFESDADDLSDDADFDADNEDGIFAPEKPKKKSSGFKRTGIVVIIALLSGGAFYFYNQMNSPLPAAVSSDVAANVIPEPVNQPPTDNTLPAIPTPTSDFNETPPTTQDAQAVVLDQNAAPQVPSVQNVTDPATSGISEVGSNSETSPPLITENNPPEVAPPLPEPTEAVPVPDAAPIQDVQQPAESQNNSSNNIEANNKALVPEQNSVAQPDPEVLNPAPPVQSAPPKETTGKEAPKSSEPEKAHETVKAPSKKTEPKMVYFDAPKGKALRDIQPPSIDPMREPGESIIIVHKGSSPSSDMIVEKGDQSEFVESKLINATRAANLGNYEAALGFYNDLYKKNPNDPRILMGRAVALQKLGENQKAIDAYRDVLDVDEDNPEAITNLMGLIGKTQPAVALQNLLELREQYPRNAAVAAQLGVAYSQSGNPQDGLKYLNMAAGMQPENPLHPFNMAVIYEHLNDREKAIKYYEQALDTFAVNGSGTTTSFSREQIYDRLSVLRGN